MNGAADPKEAMISMEQLYTNVAPLRNVAALLSLVVQVRDRQFGLPGLAVFYGPSGWGKTTAATYASNRFDACHVEIKSLWRTKQVLQQIALELGLRPARTAPDIFEQVAKTLGRQQRPLLLDEADHLCRDEIIEMIRGLHEASGVPVILIGEELLPQKLQRWERVHGRILAWVAAQEAELADVGHLATIYCPGVDISPDLRQRLLIESKLSIRRVSINLALLREFAVGRDIRKATVENTRELVFFTGEAPAPRRETVATIARMTTAARAARRVS